MRLGIWLSSSLLTLITCLSAPNPLSAAETQGDQRERRISPESITPERIIVEPPIRGDFTVRARTDRNLYTIGDRVRITFSASHNARVYIFNTDAEGVTRQIFPNYYDRDNEVRAGRSYAIPEDNDYTLRVTGPSGDESIRIVAYRNNWRALRDWSDFERGDPFPRRSVSPQDMKRRIEREAGESARGAEERQSDQPRRDRDSRALSIVPGPPDRDFDYAEDYAYFTVRRTYYRPLPPREVEPQYPRQNWPDDRPYYHPRPYEPSASTATAKVRITSDPDQCDVFIDGYYRGRTPDTFRVEPGRREIVVYHARYGTRTTQLYLYAGRTSSMSLSLK